MDFTANDHRFMSRALQLAKRGLYTTEPNPRVGCVLVKDGKIIGEGFHHKAGHGHAEVNALAHATTSPDQATAYVTLEPCSHHGKTPPCAEALIAAKVHRVISAMEDPNPLVAGRGHQMLEQAGIHTSSGLMATAAEAINPGFCRRMRTGLPYVRVKQAMSLDGRTAMASGESQWITGSAARSDVQKLRARSSAIVTGIGTVLMDNPALTLRASQLLLDNADEVVERQPFRVVMDSRLQTPTSAQLLQQPGHTLICYQQDPNNKAPALTAAGAELLQFDELTPEAVLRRLATDYQCNEVLIEAGSQLAGSFTQAGLVDEWVVYVAPKLLGSNARPLLTLPLDAMAEQVALKQTDMRMLGDDIRLTFIRGENA